MAVSAVSSNYSQRRVDLSIFPELAVSGRPVAASFGLDGDVFARAIAGPAKAVQNFGRFLLTPVGAIASRPTLGSAFCQRLLAGGILYPSDLTQLFQVEGLRLLRALRSLETPATLPDESISTADLLSAAVTPTGVTLKIGFTMRSGDQTTILLPVAWSL